MKTIDQRVEQQDQGNGFTARHEMVNLVEDLREEVKGMIEPDPPNNYVEAVGIILTDLEVGHNLALDDILTLLDTLEGKE